MRTVSSSNPCTLFFDPWNIAIQYTQNADIYGITVAFMNLSPYYRDTWDASEVCFICFVSSSTSQTTSTFSLPCRKASSLKGKGHGTWERNVLLFIWVNFDLWIHEPHGYEPIENKEVGPWPVWTVRHRGAAYYEVFPNVFSCLPPKCCLRHTKNKENRMVNIWCNSGYFSTVRTNIV